MIHNNILLLRPLETSHSDPGSGTTICATPSSGKSEFLSPVGHCGTAQMTSRSVLGVEVETLHAVKCFPRHNGNFTVERLDCGDQFTAYHAQDFGNAEPKQHLGGTVGLWRRSWRAEALTRSGHSSSRSASRAVSPAGGRYLDIYTIKMKTQFGLFCVLYGECTHATAYHKVRLYDGVIVGGEQFTVFSAR